MCRTMPSPPEFRRACCATGETNNFFWEGTALAAPQAKGKMNQIKGARFLVTGGAGFVGSTITDQLLGAGAAEVRILDNFIRGTWANVAEAQKSGRVQVVEGDVRDAALVNRLTEGVDYVFHQAALRITRCAEFPREAVEVLMGGMLNVLEACVTHKVKKIVAASSA